jgi:hypothetical protein
MRCPACDKEMETGFLYVRGVGGSLFWSRNSGTGLLSREGLEQIDLTRLSVTGTATQAVLGASRCPGCATVAFRAT